jgi:hypothetical protein
VWARPLGSPRRDRLDRDRLWSWERPIHRLSVVTALEVIEVIEHAITQAEAAGH